MSLVGILTEKANEKYIMQGLKEKNFKQDQIFFLKENTIKNLKNIKFETIIIGKKISKNKQDIRNLIQNAKYVVFNADIKENLNLLENLSFSLITYGFNPKATVTTSSVEEGKIMVCLQRTIENLNGNKIELQEISRDLPNNISSYAVMELLILGLLYFQ